MKVDFEKQMQSQYKKNILKNTSNIIIKRHFSSGKLNQQIANERKEGRLQLTIITLRSSENNKQTHFLQEKVIQIKNRSLKMQTASNEHSTLVSSSLN